MSITISSSEALSIAEGVKGIKATETQIRHAYYQSIARAMKRSANKLSHHIASELNIPLKLIRRRIFIFRRMTAKGSFKLWAGLNDIPIDKLGRPKRLGSDVIVRNEHINNAYITKKGLVYLRANKERATISIDNEAEQIIRRLLPYYFFDYFEKEFKQLLKFKYGV